ncbi:site-specific integrase [Lentzea sp. NEAU-D13]|uniref:Site-specific integrase n=1 Tax=Lentzea alba TaxID=2714351 RepID=A0A7C9VUP0_9PSEU|nr:site-specific integrase [Lentzea alba]
MQSRTPDASKGVALGSTFKRCSCRNPATNKLFGQSCPKLRRSEHGTWGYRIELPADANGERRPRRRTTFDSETAAQDELDLVRRLLAIPRSGDTKALTQVGDLIAEALRNQTPIPDEDTVRRRVRPKGGLRDRIQVGPYFLEWLPKRKGISKNTRRSYESHIRLYLVPYLGDIWLDELESADFTLMFERIEEFNERIEELRNSPDPDHRALVRYRRPVGIASMHRIVATACKGLNDAMHGDGLITLNPAVRVELPPEVRPKPLIWTEARVARWLETGEIPGKVMVWTPEQTGAFLDFIAHHRLYAFFHLLAHAGLRRGEGLGQYWVDLDEEAATLAIRFQLLQVGWETEFGTPKTDSSVAIITLDRGTVLELRAHRSRQQRERDAAGDAWVDLGLMFTEPDGSPLHPADVTDLFNKLVEQAGLPPIRLHDLRHGAATFALASGADMKVVSSMLRHSSITITADTYTGVLPQVARKTAEGIARLVPRKVASVRVLPDHPAIEDHPRLGLTSGSQTMIHNDETENEDGVGKCKEAGRDESQPASLEYAARDSNPGPAD